MFASLRSRLMMDRGVSLAVAGRVWQFFSGGVSLYLVARYFTPELQGFYYAFASLLGSQMFFDLGLGAVLTLVASHEWGGMREADSQASTVPRRRLGELIAHARRWYIACGLVYAAIVLPGGFWFFAGESHSELSWRLPWCCGVLLSTLNFALIPSLAIIEGCNFIVAIQGCRLVSAIVGSLVVWTCIVLDGGLWTLVASCAVRLLVEAYVVMIQFRPFFRQAVASIVPDDPQLRWRKELLPLQWRIAVQNLFAYVAQQAYTPIIFKFHGPELGGRMGMTWSAVTTIQMASSSWIQTRVPELGRLLSERNRLAALRLFRRALRIALGVHVAASLAFLTLVAVLGSVWPAMADRVLDLPTIAVLVSGTGLGLVTYALGVFVRLHKIDPFLRLSVASSILTGILVWWLGATLGPIGAAWGHLGVTGLLVLPLTRVIYRRTVESSD